MAIGSRRGGRAHFTGDASAADLALCNLLAFYTGCDGDHMDRLFRKSALSGEVGQSTARVYLWRADHREGDRRHHRHVHATDIIEKTPIEVSADHLIDATGRRSIRPGPTSQTMR